jgi:mannose-1-phosphate guanylyltransferase/phosphomannomutase
VAERIEAALGNGDALGIQITYSPEPVLLGTGGPLFSRREYFGNEPFVVLNCDTIMDLDLSAMVMAHREHGGIATFALRESDSPAAYSAIEIDTKGQLRRMRLLVDRAAGKFDDYPAMLAPESAGKLRPFMYCGAMVCEPAVLEQMPGAPPFSLMSDLFAPLLAQGLPMFGHVQSGYFRTVDDLKAYEQLRSEFAVSPPPLPYIQ